MVEFVAVFAAQLAAALIESHDFTMFAHHVIDSITRFLLT
jgi:hypothetical protein